MIKLVVEHGSAVIITALFYYINTLSRIGNIHYDIYIKQGKNDSFVKFLSYNQNIYIVPVTEY